VLETGGKTTVHAEDLSGDDGCDGQCIEGVHEGFPDLDVASSLALIVKAVY